MNQALSPLPLARHKTKKGLKINIIISWKSKYWWEEKNNTWNSEENRE
jgi:hypothetical protein